MPHAALLVVQDLKEEISCLDLMFQCRTRLCWWCKDLLANVARGLASFNAARGFVGGARMTIRITTASGRISMPHAALLVVQDVVDGGKLVELTYFNAARGFVGGAS